MPAMLRSNKKAIKIVRDLLGTPDSFKDKKSSKQRQIDRELMQQETRRVR